MEQTHADVGDDNNNNKYKIKLNFKEKLLWERNIVLQQIVHLHI